MCHYSEMAANSQLKRAFKRMTRKVVANVNAMTVFDHLFENDVIGDADNQELTPVLHNENGENAESPCTAPQQRPSQGIHCPVRSSKERLQLLPVGI